MRITLIGSGNVATHLAAALKNAGHRIVQVYSPNMHNAALLAYHVGATAVDSLADVSAETDLFIIAVKDDAIAELVPRLSAHQKLIVHTSGAVSLQTLLEFTTNAGIFYPLQTFSKTKELDFWQVPLCIEGADEQITKHLEELARTISNNVYRVSSAQRKVLHLAAVFACNFTNYLYGIAQGLLQENELSFDMLRPLIAETADKIKVHSPALVQTGPAIRNDEKTMQAHLQMLEGKAGLKKIYQLLSQDIIKNDNLGNGDK
ncbi:oxidoreductase [Mucilaginibacter sp. PAMC 26640]|nr:oxidoreductase [Mucilaginibacter sp. PAMC 26640]